MDTRTLTCPNCQSRNVKWRPRRWYDGPLNFVETMLTGATVMKTNDGITPMQYSYMDARYMETRQVQEHRRIRGRRPPSCSGTAPTARAKARPSKRT